MTPTDSGEGSAVIEPPAWLVDLYRKTGGKGWEPKDISGPGVKLWVERGYIKIVDGRCGFERLRDSMLSWTPAAHAALSSRAAVDPAP